MPKASVLIDSSVWIEIFRSGPLGKICQHEVESNELLGIPSLVLYEVYRKITSSVSEDLALSAIALLKKYGVLELDSGTALSAADLSIELKLGMADSIVLAHARLLNAELITLDNDFAGIDGVRVLRKR